MLTGVVVVVIVWYFDLQLHVQLVPITTNVVSWNPAQARRTRNLYMMMFMLLKNDTTGATSEAGTAHHSGAPEFTPCFI
jgi:hypothetical protein